MPSPSGIKGSGHHRGGTAEALHDFQDRRTRAVFRPGNFDGGIPLVSDLAAKLSLPLFVLGGGSNILVSDAGFDGVVVHPVCRGITILHEDHRRRNPGSERRRSVG